MYFSFFLPFATLFEEGACPFARYTDITGVQFASIKIKEVYLFKSKKLKKK